jgi:HEAT repeat protein
MGKKGLGAAVAFWLAAASAWADLLVLEGEILQTPSGSKVLRLRIGQQEVEVPESIVVRVFTEGEASALQDPRFEQILREIRSRSGGGSAGPEGAGSFGEGAGPGGTGSSRGGEGKTRIGGGGGRRQDLEDVDAGPLLDALQFPDKRVRYKAAETLVRLDPRRPYLFSDQVIGILSGAVGETGVREVLVVTSDLDLGNRIKGAVRAAGLVPVLETSGPEALRTAKRFPAKDLIILDTALGTLDAAGRLVESYPVMGHYQRGYRDIPDERLKYGREVFLELKRDFRTAGTPVLLVSLPDQGERKVRTWVEQIYQGDQLLGTLVLPPPGEGWAGLEEELRRQLRSFAEGHPPRDAAQRWAEDMSRRACGALSGADRKRTALKLEEAVGALSAVAGEQAGSVVRDPAVRLSAMEALGTIGSPGGGAVLLQVFGNRQNEPSLRVRAADSLGRIAAVSGWMPEEVYASLRSGLAEEDPAIWNACARALGLAQMPVARVQPVMAEERLGQQQPAAGR